MLWGQFIVQWLHVFFAIVWFGGVVLMFTVVSPALKHSDPAAAGQVGAQLARRAPMLLGPSAALTIIFGLLRATVFGPARSWSFFVGSAYGTTLTVAIVLSVILAILGGVTGKTAHAMGSAPPAERPKVAAKLQLLSGFMVIGFVFVLTCMILMRYGL